jgi:hypothetical protein
MCILYSYFSVILVCCVILLLTDAAVSGNIITSVQQFIMVDDLKLYARFCGRGQTRVDKHVNIES